VWISRFLVEFHFKFAYMYRYWYCQMNTSGMFNKKEKQRKEKQSKEKRRGRGRGENRKNLAGNLARQLPRNHELLWNIVQYTSIIYLLPLFLIPKHFTLPSLPPFVSYLFTLSFTLTLAFFAHFDLQIQNYVGVEATKVRKKYVVRTKLIIIYSQVQMLSCWAVNESEVMILGTIGKCILKEEGLRWGRELTVWLERENVVRTQQLITKHCKLFLVLIVNCYFLSSLMKHVIHLFSLTLEFTK
jgi:hypothetical protein